MKVDWISLTLVVVSALGFGAKPAYSKLTKPNEDKIKIAVLEARIDRMEKKFKALESQMVADHVFTPGGTLTITPIGGSGVMTIGDPSWSLQPPFGGSVKNLGGSGGSVTGKENYTDATNVIIGPGGRVIR